MDQRGGQGTLRDAQYPLDTVFAVQQCRPESLAAPPRHPGPKIAVDFQAGAEGAALRQERLPGAEEKLASGQQRYGPPVPHAPPPEICVRDIFPVVE